MNREVNGKQCRRSVEKLVSVCGHVKNSSSDQWSKKVFKPMTLHEGTSDCGISKGIKAFFSFFFLLFWRKCSSLALLCHIGQTDGWICFSVIRAIRVHVCKL